jgi:Spy/CpxP family protein refolding chaperone
MKTRLRILSLTVLIITSFASFARADTPPVAVTGGPDVSSPNTQQPAARFKRMREKKMAATAALLELTDAQKSQIKSIISAARQTNAPLIQKLANDRKNVRELSRAVPFDEAAVRALIASDEPVRTDLALSRIKVRNQIRALLTPEQQAKAKQLRLFASDKQYNWGNGGF